MVFILLLVERFDCRRHCPRLDGVRFELRENVDKGFGIFLPGLSLSGKITSSSLTLCSVAKRSKTAQSVFDALLEPNAEVVA